MNWLLVATLFFVLLLILIIAGTLIMYIRHWANRLQGAGSTLSNHEGSYFVRYIPPGLHTYDSFEVANATGARSRGKMLQYGLSALVAFSMTGVLATTTYMNRDKLVASIDLTEQELKNLTITSHQWKTQDIQKLPTLDEHLSSFKRKGMILVFSNSLEPWPHNGKSLTERARIQWNDFADKHQLAIMDCSWGSLMTCRKGREDWLHVILPGHWYKDSMDALLREGSKLLVYGPPQQIFEPDHSGVFPLGILEFVSTSTPDLPDIALVADQELTLGFDAGLIMEVKPAFNDYQANSLHPQAVTISNDHLAGGNAHTRLFAQAYGETGRLVWMDFSPNADDHAEELNKHYFQGLMASIFRYLEGKPYAAWANWPQGARFAALMEEDTEDQFQNAERVATFFKEKNYPITWYMLSNDAQKNRDLTRFLAEAGEVACHGDNHQNFALNDLQTQHIRLARCKKVIEELTGKPVLAFRPPEEKHNTDTLSAILNNGMSYFIAKNSGDRFSPTLYVSQNHQKSLVSIPRMNTDDYALWDSYKLSDSESLHLLQREADWVGQVGGLMVFSFHTQYMGNDHYFNTVKGLADYISSNAYFATAGDMATWWRLRQRLLENQTIPAQEMQKFQPVYLQVGSNGIVQRQAVTDTSSLAVISNKEQPQ